MLSLQLFLVAVSVPVMFLATAIEERRAAEGRPRQVLEAAPNAMVMMTEEGEITLVNTAVEVVFGYDREELIGRSIDVADPRSSLSFCTRPTARPHSPLQEHARCRRGGNCSVDARTPAKCLWKSASRPSRPRKGDSSWRRSSTSRSGNTRSTRRSGISAELAHVTRLSTMGELATSLAHELNQPLTAILSNVQAAQRYLSASPPTYGGARDPERRRPGRQPGE